MLCIWRYAWQETNGWIIVEKKMEKRNFYLDIKKSIEQHFAFLGKYEFGKFEEEQVAYEVHLKVTNLVAAIDISFEATASTPIWARINGYAIENIEHGNKNVETYRTRLSMNYDHLFHQYLKTNDSAFLHQIADQYAANGKQINDDYLLELSEILKRNIGVLKGDFEQLKSNTEMQAMEYETKRAAEHIKNGLFTLEYQFLSSEVFDAFEEFQGVAEIRKYLSERSEIKKYRVLDCYMNEISW
ncbi:hypothetical protein ACTJIJ_08810 [Niabella sp. 22666]|uniref:hypothetical protein n=1 Tax=Niabella sp. 22666 TaxID=3453954 RepID=UPI003F86F39D